MSDRNLTTSTRQVFGDVEKGTVCRICGRNVDDGRMKYCSDYCSNLASAVMSLLNWNGVRRRVLERDEHTCQICDWDQSRERLARSHIKVIIDSKLPERPEAPSILDVGSGDVSEEEWDEYYEENEQWQEQRDELHKRYGNPHAYDNRLEVDHIQPISEGGHPFDPANLQTLCEDCHGEKTVREATERAENRTPSRGDLSESLFEFAGGETDA